MKICIMFEFKDGPWGGGNQFLKALRNRFIQMGVYEDDPFLANALLFNSHHFGNYDHYQLIKKIREKRKDTLIFHRIDGPISLVRGNGLEIDQAVIKFNQIFADGTIYQSHWIESESLKLGLESSRSTVVLNAPDPLIFFPSNNLIKKGEKIKVIATSWSGNIRKGFDVYQWLDENLDFSRYTMTFVGNSPVNFQNIIYKPAMNSNDLANELRENHIFITASKFEPCSNSLLEAMHCRLPAIAYNNGGNPEIVKNGGELFTTNSELIYKLDAVANNYEQYKSNIDLPDISEVAKKYFNFMNNIWVDLQQSRCVRKVIEQDQVTEFADYLRQIGLFESRHQEDGLISFKKMIEKLVGKS